VRGRAGFYISVVNAEQWGDHVYFHATEHFDGKGPQLVIEPVKISPASYSLPPLPRKESFYQLPPADARFTAWSKSRRRLAGFARHAEMSPQQARLFYFFDTHIRHELILKRYQLPVLDAFNRIEQALADDDAAAAQRELDEIRRRMLVWEYIRETSWYTSGPLADVLSPRQLGILFGRSIFGRMEERAGEEDRSIWQVVPPDKFDAHVERTLRDMRNRLKLSPQQVETLRPYIAEYERLENDYLAKFRENLLRVQAMIEQDEVDDAAMLEEVRQLHLNHEAFLYYQSIYNTPRWELWTDHLDPRPLARWIVEVRRRHYESASRAVTEE